LCRAVEVCVCVFPPPLFVPVMLARALPPPRGGEATEGGGGGELGGLHLQAQTRRYTSGNPCVAGSRYLSSRCEADDERDLSFETKSAVSDCWTAQCTYVPLISSVVAD